jgi:hypothetical protein
MDFGDQLKNLADRVGKVKAIIQTEEATKNALIMPFIQCLGYDVFNPLEVSPEYITDVGIKKGEKIDYAIMKDMIPAILIECKHHDQNLDLHDGQLLRYFHVSKARFGILTNGIRYRFYTDLEEANKMDEKPFLEFDLTELKDAHIEELKKFHKSYYDPEKIFTTASDLKFMNELRSLLNTELRDPSEKFVRYLAGNIYKGRITERIVIQFTDLVKRSFHQLLSDMVTERLKAALHKEATEAKEQADQQAVNKAAADLAKERAVETTPEEMEAYFIIKSILHPVGLGARVSLKDNLSYCNVIMDDSVRKTVCRFHFSGGKKFVLVFDQPNGTRIDIDAIEDIYKASDQIRMAARIIDQPVTATPRN